MHDIGGGRPGKRHVVILIVVVALVAVAGYILLSQGVAYSGSTLTVRAIDSSTGYPLIGVNVTVDNITIETDSDGVTRFNLPPGDHVVISLQKDGYKPKSFTASLSDDNLVTLDLLKL